MGRGGVGESRRGGERSGEAGGAQSTCNREAIQGMTSAYFASAGWCCSKKAHLDAVLPATGVLQIRAGSRSRGNERLGAGRAAENNTEQLYELYTIVLPNVDV